MAATVAALLLVAVACGDDAGDVDSEPLSRAEFCVLANPLDDLVGVGTADDFDAQLAGLEGVLERAPTAIRPAFEEFVDALRSLAVDGDDALDGVELPSDDAFVAASDEVEAYCADEEPEPSTDALSDVGANLESELDALSEALEDVDDELAAEIEERIADIDDLEELDSLGEVLLGEVGDFEGFSESGLQAEVADCYSDLEASAVGDNAGCDALYVACQNGNMAACNDLWINSNGGSVYTDFGATCGERVAEGSEPSFGRCELIS